LLTHLLKQYKAAYFLPGFKAPTDQLREFSPSYQPAGTENRRNTDRVPGFYPAGFW
jgi:hypothetical protein